MYLPLPVQKCAGRSHKGLQCSHKNRNFTVYGSSATLAKQIEFGAPADIFLSANVPGRPPNEEDIIQARSTKNILNNKLVLITTDHTIQEIEDLASTDFSKLLQNEKIAMGMVSSVPAGIYSKQALKYLRNGMLSHHR